MNSKLKKLVLITATAITIFSVTNIIHKKSRDYTEFKGYISHQVYKGDTLWSIAKEYQPTGDVRELVHHISKVNGDLKAHELQEGQELLIPIRQGEE